MAIQKRGMIFGDYDTAAHGWTLQAGWVFSPAEQKTNFVDIPGGDGAVDLSTALTDGIPRYNNRTLTAVFELSTGDRSTREVEIRQMVNTLDGLRLNITLPDDPGHYITGLVHVAREYNDLAHAAVTVTAICDPWKYANAETVVSKMFTGAAETMRLTNNGRRAVVPTLSISGDTRPLELTFGEASVSFNNGTYKWPELLLTTGSHTLTAKGYGNLKITYREAVLE